MEIKHLLQIGSSISTDSKCALVITQKKDTCAIDEKKILSAQELEFYQKLTHEARRQSFLLGRHCSKTAIDLLIRTGDLTSFSVLSGIFRHPLIRGLSKDGLTLSLSHSKKCAASIAYFDHYPCGIDIEEIHPKNEQSITSVLSEKEQTLISSLSTNHTTRLTICWCAKESLSKTLKTGWTIPHSFYEIGKFIENKNYTEVLYQNFPQYSSINFQWESYILSITKPSGQKIYGLF